MDNNIRYHSTYIPSTAYDATAEYTVAHTIFNRALFITNVLTATATFAKNIRIALDDGLKAEGL